MYFINRIMPILISKLKVKNKSNVFSNADNIITGFFASIKYGRNKAALIATGDLEMRLLVEPSNSPISK